jgi:hypothetical protein
LITGTTDADRFCSVRLLLLLALLCPLLPPLGHFAPRLGTWLGRAGKSALLARVKHAAAAGYANLLVCRLTAVAMPCLALSAAHLAGWDVDGNACGALLALLIKAAAAAA